MDIDIKRNATESELGYSEETAVDYSYKEFEPPKMLAYWQAVSRYALILFAALTPIFFLPFTQLPVAVHKEVLVFSLILVIFFAMLGRILLEGRIRYPGHLLVLALLVLVAVWGASSFFFFYQIGRFIWPLGAPGRLFSVVLF